MEIKVAVTILRNQSSLLWSLTGHRLIGWAIHIIPVRVACFSISAAESTDAARRDAVASPSSVLRRSLNAVQRDRKGSARAVAAEIRDGDGWNTGVTSKRLAVFVSGGASTTGRSTGQLSVAGCKGMWLRWSAISGWGGAEHAKENGVLVVVYPKWKASPEGVSTGRGHLKFVPVELARAYPRSILNIHPSLLAAFGGKGWSVVPMLANNTPKQFAARILRGGIQEHQVYVEEVSSLCHHQIEWLEDGVHIIRSRIPNEYT
ncbi:hypothetical protein EJB05_48422, partial [Eragrostis curvula]